MTAFLIANMAPIMFASLVLFLLLGYPVAFSLAFTGLFWGILGIEMGIFPAALLQAMQLASQRRCSLGRTRLRSRHEPGDKFS